MELAKPASPGLLAPNETGMKKVIEEPQTAGTEDDPAAGRLLAAELDVFRHERLAYCEAPARPPTVSWRKKFFRLISRGIRFVCRVIRSERSGYFRRRLAGFKRRPGR